MESKFCLAGPRVRIGRFSVVTSLSPSRPSPNSPWRFLPDFLAFCLGYGAALTFGWSLPELIWSLWISSLVVGIFSFFVTLGAGAISANRFVESQEIPQEARGFLAFGGIVVGLFMLGFFCFHFGMFHLVHGAFLSLFFPLSPTENGLAPSGPFEILESPVRAAAFLGMLISSFWWMILATLISERHSVFAPLWDEMEKPEERMTGEFPGNFSALGSDRSQIDTRHGEALKQQIQKKAGDFTKGFTRPYANVIRMHLLIFFFAFAQMAQLEGVVVFTVVYAVYFFPWSALRPKLTNPCNSG
jgi:hypothetical protein